mgnify:CR=1 FL=1
MSDPRDDWFPPDEPPPDDPFSFEPPPDDGWMPPDEPVVLAPAAKASALVGAPSLKVLSEVYGYDAFRGDQGAIVEEGSHAGLLAANGLYARLWQRQSGGFIDADDAPGAGRDAAE